MVNYSELNFEYFKVGLFLKNVTSEYKKSLDDSMKFKSLFLDGQKIQIYTMQILTLFSIFIILIIFYNVYNKRILLSSLGLTVFIFIFISLSFVTLSKKFNQWTVFVDLCQETLDYQ